MLKRAVRPVLVVALAIAGLAVAPAPSAQAAVPAGPTAVAVAPNGITYAGYAAGGSLVRIDASGSLLSPVNLSRSGPIDGLATDESGNIWVSSGSGASKVNASGGELLHLDYTDAPACPSTDADSPARYGDIAVWGGSIYVSQRCANRVQRYNATTGALQASITTSSRTRGIAVSSQNGFTDRVFVALPDEDKVLSFNANFGNGAAPVKTLVPFKDGSWATPTPTGLAIDAFGQLAVVDTANNAVTLYDINSQDPSSYRTLGHPTAASDQRGSYDAPTAIDWYRQDRSLNTLDGRLFLADTGNTRIQSMDTSGGTIWVASATGGDGGSAPINTEAPTVQGNPAVGQTLTCNKGTFTGNPTSFEYGWNRNNSYISGETNATYTVKNDDGGKKISCFVRAINANDQMSDYATSGNVTIATGGGGTPTPSSPVNVNAPAITGTAEVGGTLTCSNGTWTGNPAPRFTRVWKHVGGTPIPGATNSTYTVTTDDVGQPLICNVTATNGVSPNASAKAAPVTPAASVPPSACPGRSGVTINNAATYTNSASVTLRIRPPAGATQVLISNDGGFDTAQIRALDASCLYGWTLNTVNGRATQNVYVRFVGGGVDELNTLSDDVVFDATAPTLAKVRTKKVAKRTYVVKVSASDKVSGPARVQHASRRNAPGKIEAYHRNYRTTNLKSFTWVRVFDKAGNHSAWRRRG